MASVIERDLNKKAKQKEFAKNFKKNYPLLLFILPATLVVLIFHYIPFYGILIAFQDYVPGDSILSPYADWIGLQNFRLFFNDYKFWTLLTNTFLLCLYGFVVGFPLPLIVALMLNALKSKRMSKVLQTIYNAPHFISLVVMVGMLYLFFGRFGLANNIAVSFGGERYSYFLEPNAFRPLYILSSNWQDFGWSAIIYLAALSSVDPQIHEAAIIDGATRFERVIHIDFPAIAGTVSILLILSIGSLMGVGYEKVLLMQTGTNLTVSEIISTHVYTRGLTGNAMPGYATAVGLFNSVINLVLLGIANTLSKRFSSNSLF